MEDLKLKVLKCFMSSKNRSVSQKVVMEKLALTKKQVHGIYEELSKDGFISKPVSGKKTVLLKHPVEEPETETWSPSDTSVTPSVERVKPVQRRNQVVYHQKPTSNFNVRGYGNVSSEQMKELLVDLGRKKSMGAPCWFSRKLISHDFRMGWQDVNNLVTMLINDGWLTMPDPQYNSVAPTEQCVELYNEDQRLSVQAEMHHEKVERDNQELLHVYREKFRRSPDDFYTWKLQGTPYTFVLPRHIRIIRDFDTGKMLCRVVENQMRF